MFAIASPGVSLQETRRDSFSALRVRIGHWLCDSLTVQRGIWSRCAAGQCPNGMPRMQSGLARDASFCYSARLCGATWRSGYATVCKTVYSGSIPDVASTSISYPNLSRMGAFKALRAARDAGGKKNYVRRTGVKGLLTLWWHLPIVFP